MRAAQSKGPRHRLLREVQRLCPVPVAAAVVGAGRSVSSALSLRAVGVSADRRKVPLRARLLRDKEHLCAAFVMSGSPTAAELLARIYPVVVVDCEHGSCSMGGELQQLVQAVQAGGAEVLVRVPRLSTPDITRALDCGAAGIIVPMIETAAQAREALAAARYPPLGRRGVAASVVRASGWGLQHDYADIADERALVIVQVETRQAAESEEEMSAIASSGVDGVFIGPLDLSASAGHLRDLDHPDVRELREHVEAACRRHGTMLCGFAAGRGFSAREMLQQRGYRLVASCVDVALLRDAALANFRDATGS